ncbi:unnamed protein product [Onchocerca flexuosa]|uniref:Uncharacterized protein n=1 Tax=Onchocerca flexuosa TaxID=387005 RepID=A0A183HQG7_9BILA|nr:unnamed protein product [Onchocerca flexuosa]
MNPRILLDKLQIIFRKTNLSSTKDLHNRHYMCNYLVLYKYHSNTVDHI